MSISERDVRHIAALARLGLDDARIPALAAELDSILGHMEVLQRVDVSAAGPPAAVEGMALRDDIGPGHMLVRPLPSFAPRMYDDFFLVPRLATHETVDE